MKNLFVAILFLTVLFSCNKKISRPIVDYTTNYDNNRRMLDLFSVKNTQDQQTIALIDKKECSFDTFKELLKKGKIEGMKKVIKDSVEIEQLHYPYKKVKTIIIATKK